VLGHDRPQRGRTCRLRSEARLVRRPPQGVLGEPRSDAGQGNDVGTQYRSGIYAYDAQQRTSAETSKAAYQAKLQEAGYGAITTEIEDAPEFYFAEDYHQQYLAKNPDGYCGVGGTGVTCPIGLSNVG